MNIRHTNIRKIAAALSAAALAGTAFAVNPIVTHKYSADPNAFVWKDRLYVVCSHDLDGQKGFEMNDYVLMSTDDLVNWTDHGDVAMSSRAGRTSSGAGTSMRRALR